MVFFCMLRVKRYLGNYVISNGMLVEKKVKCGYIEKVCQNDERGLYREIIKR